MNPKTLQDVYGQVDKDYAEAEAERKATLTYNLNTANARQVGGLHYKDKGIQPWDYIISNNLGYLEGNVVKYVSRWKDKNGLEDLQKARHYLDKLIETSYQEEKDHAFKKQS